MKKFKGVTRLDIKFVTQPYQANGKAFLLGDKLNELLKSKKSKYDKVWFVASFAKVSGISKLKSSIKKAIANGVEINFVLGMSNKLTTEEALREILDLGCKVKIFRNNIGIGIGAKMYIFEAEGEVAEVFISSGNITEGGLYRNHEMIVHCNYDLENSDDVAKYNDFKISVSNILEPKEELINELSYELIGILVDNEEISSESDKKISNKKQSAKAVTTIIEEKEENSVSEDDFFSIELPTGESINVSLRENDNLAEKLENITSHKETIKEAKSNSIKEDEKIEEAQIDFDIEVEGISNIEVEKNVEVEKRVLEELLYEDEKVIKNNENKDDEQKYITNFEAIDIEQMLYSQNKFDMHAETEVPKWVPIINEEDMTTINSKETEKTFLNTRVNFEKVEEIEEPIKVIVTKKFIISSSFNKSKNGGVVTFFMQINKLKGKGLSGEIRIPTASRDFSPEFWGWPNSYSVAQKEGKVQKKFKKWTTTCRLIDVDALEIKKADTLELYQEEGKTTFNILSKELLSFNPEENDIIRVIRCAEAEEAMFQIELIRTSSKEYVIWEQFCSQSIKGTERKYGFA